MKISTGVPKGEHRIAIVPFCHLSNAGFHHLNTVLRSILAALHQGIFTIDVVEHIGVQERVVECRIEDFLLLLGAPTHFHPFEGFFPLAMCLITHLVKVAPWLFSI